MMNTEQALTRVLQIVHALGEDEAAIYNAVSKNPSEWKSAVGPIPQRYQAEIQEELKCTSPNLYAESWQPSAQKSSC